MKISQSQLRNAEETLSYIRGSKQETDILLYSKTHLMYSGIHIPIVHFNHALLRIHEVIDDLFSFELDEAMHIIAAWQQQDG